MDNIPNPENGNLNIESAFTFFKRNFLLCDIGGFITLINAILTEADKAIKHKHIQTLLKRSDLIVHYEHKKTKRKILGEFENFEHLHERNTAIKLTEKNYDVIFAPVGMFKRTDKRFDVFLARDFILLKADLKSIRSKNPDTIGKRIKEGSGQATRVVIDIQSDISIRDLITGLKTGCERNKQLV